MTQQGQRFDGFRLFVNQLRQVARHIDAAITPEGTKRNWSMSRSWLEPNSASNHTVVLSGAGWVTSMPRLVGWVLIQFCFCALPRFCSVNVTGHLAQLIDKQAKTIKALALLRHARARDG